MGTSLGSAMRTRRRTALMTTCVCFLALASLAGAWSGRNAHALVVLTDVDRNDALRSAFYDGPAGTVITVAVEGYDIARAGVGTDGAAVPLAGAAETPLLYDGGSGRASAPVRCALSDEWVVLERPSQRGGAGDSSGLVFLHCRLPLPRTAADVAEREAALLRLHGPRMQERLGAWWRMLGASRNSGCMYGDGEGPTTGVPRYYELCPMEAVYRVFPTRELLERIQAIAVDVPAADTVDAEGNLVFRDTSNGGWPKQSKQARKKKKAEMKKKTKEKIMDWLSSVHQSRRKRYTAHTDHSNAGVFEKVGGYHEVLSQPRWNRQVRAWEMTYPSHTPCREHFSTVGRDQPDGGANVTGTRSGAVGRDSLRDDDDDGMGSHTISPMDAYWRTTIRLRCPPDASTMLRKQGTRGGVTPQRWSVSEVRQLCQYQIELYSPLVCGWEREMDSLRVNPIPCVALN